MPLTPEIDAAIGDDIDSGEGLGDEHDVVDVFGIAFAEDAADELTGESESPAGQVKEDLADPANANTERSSDEPSASLSAAG